MTDPPWDDAAPLAAGETLLLEASAGTGKTYQIANLVLRLVTEYRVPIEQILTLTFTKAATAELRDRVRRRLQEARAALSSSTLPTEDRVLERLCGAVAGAHNLREQYLHAVEVALTSFDLAPIATIHGFSQRMLELFAFESGQESGLELIEDADLLLAEMVDDALAWAYVEPDQRLVALMSQLGWSRHGLLEVARKLTAAVEPHVVPELGGPTDAPHGQPAADDARALLRARLADMAATASTLRSWWADPLQGRRCVTALREARAAHGFKGWADSWVTASDKEVTRWLDDAPVTKLPDLKKVARLLPPGLAKDWKGSAALEAQPFFPLAMKLSAFFEKRARFLVEVNPLAVFAHGLRGRVTRELMRLRKLTFDAMLSLLADRIAAEGPSGPLARRIRERFQVALVDEFQDTDASQWRVLSAVFGAPEHPRRLLLIGDPKQAIYAFRGADVFVYLAAANTAAGRYTMTTNWRSDAPYVVAMNALWRAGSDAFELPSGEGQAGIDYVEVAAQERAPRLHGLPPVGSRERRAFEVRWFDGTLEPHGQGARLFSNKEHAKRLVARAVAAEALRLVGSGAEVDLGEGQVEALGPGHLAVLVSSHKEARLIKRALDAVGLPSVVGSTGSVFATPAAVWLTTWLRAVADGGRDLSARVIATTPLFGWTAQDLARALAVTDGGAVDDGALDWNAWCAALADWAQRFPQEGFIRVFEAALERFAVMPRVLALPDGERHATDLRQLAELLHTSEETRHLGPAELAAWLRALVPDEGDVVEVAEERALRLESDARAIQITTIHSAKGLEYPIVLLPFAWCAEGEPRSGPLVWHDPAYSDGRPVLDLRHPEDPDRAPAVMGRRREARQEKVRLLYVALTRARHHTVAWFGPAGKDRGDTDRSALGRLLLRGTGGVLPRFSGKPKDADLDEAAAAACCDALEALAARSQGTIGWSCEAMPLGVPVCWSPAALDALPSACPWTGPEALRSTFASVSFTSLAGDREVTDEEPEREPPFAVIGAPQRRAPGDAEELDEPAVAEVRDEAPSHLEGLMGGKAVGIWVHGVLEALDFSTCRGKDGTPLDELVERVARTSGLDAPPAQRALLAKAVPAFVTTPLGGGGSKGALGGLAAELCLASLSPADRLDELRFDVGLAGGARRGGAGIDALGVMAALRLRLGEDWRGARWLEHLAMPDAGRPPLFPALNGVLVGAIDLVFRVRDARHGTRYFLADFKTNRILSRERPRGSQRSHYAPAWLAWEMGRHAYHLQALIYTLALHRYLGLRVPGYDYDTHFGGHVYLFLRGMEGADTPRAGDLGCLGVFRDRWPKEVVVALDRALAGGGAVS